MKENRDRRIAEKRFKAADMYTDNGPYALTQEQIQDIPFERAYEWIRGGFWKQKHFKKWLKALRVI